MSVAVQIKAHDYSATNEIGDNSTRHSLFCLVNVLRHHVGDNAAQDVSYNLNHWVPLEKESLAFFDSESTMTSKVASDSVIITCYCSRIDFQQSGGIFLLRRSIRDECQAKRHAKHEEHDKQHSADDDERIRYQSKKRSENPPPTQRNLTAQFEREKDKKHSYHQESK